MNNLESHGQAPFYRDLYQEALQGYYGAIL